MGRARTRRRGTLHFSVLGLVQQSFQGVDKVRFFTFRRRSVVGFVCLGLALHDVEGMQDVGIDTWPLD